MSELKIDLRTEVEKQIENGFVETDLRPYLGISNIAHPCERHLWYQFRFALREKIIPRVERLLSRGNREEEIVLADLKKIGILVYGQQDGVVTGHGHIRGHCDGKLKFVPDAPKTDHLFECKTANDKNFKKIKKEGYQKHQIYYGQIVCYMLLEKLKRTLVVVVNKNTDERYYERLDCNNSLAKELIKRAVDIISTETPPNKIGGATWWECKFCKFYNICHFKAQILKTCRTCQHCDICDNGLWQCSKFDNIELTTEQQIKACKHYKIFEVLK